jgi:hypothetical protein
MVVIALSGNDKIRPFAIARILEIRGADDYHVQWFGNENGQLQGTYRPEWRVMEEGEKVKVYFSERVEESGAKRFTSDSAGVTITRAHVQHFGFRLLYNDRLPVTLKRKMKDNKSINWLGTGK